MDFNLVRYAACVTNTDATIDVRCWRPRLASMQCTETAAHSLAVIWLHALS
jgi:hypothetical protein